MAEKKKKVGRPRKYASRAERQKAYYERKKKKMKELEKQVEQLEQQQNISFDVDIDTLENLVFQDVQSISWRKITPSEIALMATQDLRLLINEFQKRIEKQSSLEVSLENITLGILSKNHFETMNELDEEKIAELDQKIKKNITNIEERMQQQTLLYLMEAEVANRERLEGRKSKLDLFEEKIEELEKEGAEKKKVEIEKKVR